MTASAGAATAALEELGAGVPDETAEAQAAIVIVSRNRGVRQVLHRELSKRYGGDYQIVACGHDSHRNGHPPGATPAAASAAHE